MKGIRGCLLLFALILLGAIDRSDIDNLPLDRFNPAMLPMCGGLTASSNMEGARMTIQGLTASQPLTLETITPGRCTGSVYCSACKNCKYCAHCNSGGSCGVCGKKPVRTTRKPQTEVVKKYYPSRPKETDKQTSEVGGSSSDEIKTATTPDEVPKVYLLTQETSLRAKGEAQAQVLKRLKVGEEVVVLENSGKYWWQVQQNDRKGWVKKHLLKEKVVRIYP